LFPKLPDRSGAHAASFSTDIGSSLIGVTLQQRKIKHPPPSSSAVRNVWVCVLFSSICLGGVYRNNFNVRFTVNTNAL